MDEEADFGSKVGNVGVAAGGLGKTVLFALKDIVALIVAFFALILLFGGLYLTSALILEHGDEIISTVEFSMRCQLYPSGIGYLPFLRTVRDVYEVSTCWTNSVGLINRLISTKFLLRETKACLGGADKSFLDVLIDISNMTKEFFFKTTEWIFTNLFIQVYPAYPIVAHLDIVMTTIRDTLDCLCDILRPLWKFITVIFQDNEFFCFLHQGLNGVLSFIQISITTAVNVSLDILTTFLTGTILQVLTYIWNLQVTIYPNFTIAFDKLVAAFESFGQFLNNIFVKFACIIVSEVEQGPNGDAAVEARYQQCLIDAEVVRPACLIAKILIVPTRLIQVIFQLALGIFRVFTPIDDFKWNVWNPNILWDTIRNPLNITGSPFVNDSWVDRDNNSTIEIPFNGTMVTCNETVEITNSSVPCLECPRTGNTSLETCFCNEIMDGIDDLLVPVINLRIFRPIFCGGVFSLVRVAVAILKFGVDFLRTIEFDPAPKIIDLLANRITYDRVLNEIGGPPNQLAGFLYFPNGLILALVPNHPDLECIPAIITYTLKFILEIIRIILYFVQAFFADVRLALPSLGLTNPFTSGTFITNYLCISPYGENCADTEAAFQWLRIPRNSSFYYQEEVPIIVVPTNTTPGIYQRGALECLCKILNLEFLPSFASDIPSLAGFDIPNICCAIYNVGRVIASTAEFLLQDILIALLQTIMELTVSGVGNGRIFILENLACLTNNSLGPCSSINAVLNDVTDTVACGCLFIDELLAIPQVAVAIPDKKPLYCLCNLFTALTSIVGNALIVTRNGAQIVVGVFGCINVTSGLFQATPECQIFLPALAVEIFDRLGLVVDIIGRAIQSLSCLIATLFYFDCLNAPPPIPCQSIDFEACVLQAGCPTYFPNETIGNNFPTGPQFNDCVNQCGNGTCTFCLNNLLISAVNFTVNSTNTTTNTTTFFVNCPYGCFAAICRPNDKIPLFIRSVYDVIGNLVRLVLSLVSDVIVFAIQQSSGMPGVLDPNFPKTFTAYFDLFLTTIGDSLFGDTFHTWGFIQYFGDFMNCIIGPPGCGVQYNNTGEGSHPVPPDPICFGNLFIVLGNLLGSVYSVIQDILIALVGIIESVLSGQFNMLSGYIKQLFTSIFKLLGVLLQQAQAITTVIIGFLAAAIEFLLTFGTQSGGPVYDAMFTLLNLLFQPLIAVLQFLYDFLVFVGAIDGKRSLFTSYLFQSSIIESEWKGFIDNLRNTGTFESLSMNIHDLFKNFSSSILNETRQNHIKRALLDAKNESDYIQKFQDMYGLTNEEMNVISNPSLLLPLITNDTYCYKVMNQLKTTSFASMSLFDELAFKTCYSLVLVPILNNAKVSKDGDGILLPFDLTYNVRTFLDTVNELKDSTTYYTNWNTPLTHLYSLISTNDDDIDGGVEKRNGINNNSSDLNEYGLMNTTKFSNFYDFIKGKGYKNEKFLLSFFKSKSNTNYFDKKISPKIDYITRLSDFLTRKNLTNSFLKATPGSKFSWVFDENDLNHISETKKRFIEKPVISPVLFKGNNVEKLAGLIYTFRTTFTKGMKRANNGLPNLFKQKTVKNENIIDYTPLRDKIHQRRQEFLAQNKDKYIEFKYGEASTTTDILKILSRMRTGTIPALYDYWFPKNNDNIAQKRSIFPEKKDNIIRFMTENIYLDRVYLVFDTLSTIFNHEIGKLANHTMEKLIETGVNHIKKRAIDEAIPSSSSSSSPRRPSLPERIVHFHSQLRGLKKIGKYVPDLPEKLVNLHHEIMEGQKRRLVTINCSCNCTIIEDFVQELLDESTYCYEKQFLGIADPLYNGTGYYTGSFIIIIPYNSSMSYPFPENYINSWLNIDLFGTIVAFFTNSNTDTRTGPVGFIYFVRTLPIPFLQLRCTRINLTCQLGVGLQKGLIISALIVFSVCVLLYLFSPPIAGVVNTVVVGIVYGGSVWLFFLFLVYAISWGFQANCTSNPTGALISYLVPFIGQIPMLPECGAREVYDIITTYIINPCPLTAFSGLGLEKLLIPINGTVDACPVCPDKLNITSCTDYGIKSPLTIFGMFLLRYLPGLGGFLQNSCLTRGNCLGWIFFDYSTSENGILASLFQGFNATSFMNQDDPILEECFYLNILSVSVGIFLLLVSLIILFYIIALSIDLIILLVAAFSLITPSSDVSPEDQSYEQQGKKIFG